MPTDRDMAVEAHVQYLTAALSWYDGGAAGADVQAAWKRVLAQLAEERDTKEQLAHRIVFDMEPKLVAAEAARSASEAREERLRDALAAMADGVGLHEGEGGRCTWLIKASMPAAYRSARALLQGQPSTGEGKS